VTRRGAGAYLPITTDGLIGQSGLVRRRGPEGWHSASSWRLLASTAVFSGVLCLLGIWQGWRPYAALTLAIALGSAFIGGYCFRQQVLDSDEPARVGFLRLKEDLDHT
jgi:hypothetical protein